MRKILFIFFLLVFNILLIYSKINNKKDINLKLKKEEIAIVIINNELSKSLLILDNNIAITYILDYQKDNNLIKDLDRFKNRYDYFFMNNNYDINISNKQLIKEKTINKIKIDKDIIKYHNISFCINKDNCDINYDYKNNIVYSKYDNYYLDSSNYLVIFIKDNYEINNLDR